MPTPSFTLLSHMDSRTLTGRDFFDKEPPLLFHSPLPSSLDVDSYPSPHTQSDCSFDPPELHRVDTSLDMEPHIAPRERLHRSAHRHPPDSFLLRPPTLLDDDHDDHDKPHTPKPRPPKSTMPHPLRTALSKTLHRLSESPSLWLALYFFLNLFLTLYNKSVLIHFPFPYTLTAIHALCGAIGTYIVLRYEHGGSSLSPPAAAAATARTPAHPSYQLGPGLPSLAGPELVVLFLFSLLYTINIVVSNASLRLVTVPVGFISKLMPQTLTFNVHQFHQVVRASTPFFTVMFSALLFGKGCSQRKLWSLVPVVAGVGFA